MSDVQQLVPPMTVIHELQLTIAKLGEALQDHQNKIEYLENADARLIDLMTIKMNNRSVNRMKYVHQRTRWWMRWIYFTPKKKTRRE